MSDEHKVVKKKLVKKKIFKNPIIISGLITIIALAGVIGGLFIFTINIPEEKILFVSHPGSVMGIDPLQTWAPPDTEVIAQVAEGLFTHENVDGTYQVVPNLAINYSRNENGTEYIFELRENVFFHDGTPFNATAVQWNINRIYNLLSLMHWGQAQFWLFDGNGSEIINRTEVIDEHTIKFILNKPYVPLPALLASQHSYILSPASTIENNFIDRITGDLVGTGPFTYDSAEFIYIPIPGFYININITFSSNAIYWKGKPKFDKLIFKRYPTENAKSEAILTGDILFSSGYNELLAEFGSSNNSIYSNESMIEAYINDPNVIVQEGPSAAHFLYLLMNNNLINATMRKSISYAFNYSALIDKWLNGHGVRPKSIIPEGILYSNNTNINLPYYNITIARQTLKDAGWNGTAGLTVNDDISPGNGWEVKAESGTPLAIYNYTFLDGEDFPWLFLDLLSKDLKQIGVKVEAAIVTIGEYYNIFFNDLNRVTLGHMYFFPKFSDPSSIFNILCSNKSTDYNYCQVNDALVQEWMEEALEETNEQLRENLYYQIQKRLIEQVFPMGLLYCKNNLNVYRTDINGVEVNPFISIYKEIYFN